ncbi:transcriptional regulator [Polymorphobacter glacialis]|uniref:Transcriptional regulator n=1 Tax=Sandarakinorhabdus glacialis TaxID=1614636 RepID=A0A916ZJ05_9SPHN|nr:winged helix-turn-helix transcriptional regulator [Polymorphobacter glacialis]GGD99999.1 transcriptional regulator [Polymorphobacter glacialis]
MTAKRRYDDACGAAHGLDLVGERWALLVMRELLMGPRRFGDLRADLPGISANVLTQRLEGLEAAGILGRRKLPPPVSAQVYELTAWGLESVPIFGALGRWAARSPGHDPRLPLSAVSLMLSFGTMFDAGLAGRLAARIGFVIGRESYVVAIADGRISVGRGAVEGVDVVFSGAASAVAGVVYGGESLAGMVASGALGLVGDRGVAARFVGLFPLPVKAGALA